MPDLADRYKKMKELATSPLMIDDRELRKYGDQLIKCTKELKEILGSTAGLELLNSLNELRFIAKKVHEIERYINQIKEDGLRKNVHMDITLDGCKLQTRTLQTEEFPENPMQKIVSSLDPNDLMILQLRLGLDGKKSHTTTEISKKLNKSKKAIDGALRRITKNIVRDPVSSKKLDNPDLIKLIQYYWGF